jgi:hypothetical protein
VKVVLHLLKYDYWVCSLGGSKSVVYMGIYGSRWVAWCVINLYLLVALGPGLFGVRFCIPGGAVLGRGLGG